jgi:hypothetical protein
MLILGERSLYYVVQPYLCIIMPSAIIKVSGTN